MLPINYVHLLPAIYYICSPCAAAILRSRFRNNLLWLNFGRILLVGALGGFPWQFSFISRDRESVTVGMHWALCQLAYLMSMLSDFFFTESVENWKYRASLLTCIECSAVLHILYHQLNKHKSQYSLSLFDSRPLLFPEKIKICFVPSLKICLLSNTIVCLLLVIALVKYSKGHHLLALNWR